MAVYLEGYKSKKEMKVGDKIRFEVRTGEDKLHHWTGHIVEIIKAHTIPDAEKMELYTGEKIPVGIAPKKYTVDRIVLKGRKTKGSDKDNYIILPLDEHSSNIYVNKL
jgi:hypothetical protein